MRHDESPLDHQTGAVARSVFDSPGIYEVEQRKVFGRSWLFVAHESQIRDPGDVVVSRMAEDSVIVSRQDAGDIVVTLNVCRHRGMRLCRADEGHAKRFTCSYHGWSSDGAGTLVDVPHESDGYRDRLDKARWSLVRVPHVESFLGLVFACWDTDAMPLTQWLGRLWTCYGGVRPLFRGHRGSRGCAEVAARGKLEARRRTVHRRQLPRRDRPRLRADRADRGQDPRSRHGSGSRRRRERRARPGRPAAWARRRRRHRRSLSPNAEHVPAGVGGDLGCEGDTPQAGCAGHRPRAGGQHGVPELLLAGRPAHPARLASTRPPRDGDLVLGVRRRRLGTGGQGRLPQALRAGFLHDRHLRGRRLGELGGDRRDLGRGGDRADAEARYNDWFDLIADDIHYFMPLRRNRLHRDLTRETSAVGELAHYDDDKAGLAVRIRRVQQPTAWSDNPPPRTTRLITNIQAQPAEEPGQIRVRSVFHLYRNRLQDDSDSFTGYRDDVLRTDETTGFRLTRRAIHLSQSVVLAKNLGVFF